MERVISFLNGNGDILRGILHVPEREPKKIGINLLNPGLKNRVAPHRLNVKLSRLLCEKGYYVLRFDPAGVGDSEGSISELNSDCLKLWAYIQQGLFVKDILLGNRFLKSIMPCEKLILIGQCGGAASAALAGAIDPSVTGLILLDTPFCISQNAKSIEEAIFASYSRMDVIRNVMKELFSGKLILSILSKEKRKNILSKAYIFFATKNSNINIMLVKSIKDFIKRKGCVHFIFAENDFSLREFKNHFLRDYKKLTRNKPNYSVIKNANHIYAEKEWQDSLFECINKNLSTFHDSV